MASKIDEAVLSMVMFLTRLTNVYIANFMNLVKESSFVYMLMTC
jgi:hypothetical protein